MPETLWPASRPATSLAATSHRLPQAPPSPPSPADSRRLVCATAPRRQGVRYGASRDAAAASRLGRAGPRGEPSRGLEPRGTGLPLRKYLYSTVAGAGRARVGGGSRLAREMARWEMGLRKRARVSADGAAGDPELPEVDGAADLPHAIPAAGARDSAGLQVGAAPPVAGHRGAAGGSGDVPLCHKMILE